MSEKINDGGPAFARAAAEHSQGGHYEQDGMTLRDWFAGQALAGYLASDEGHDCRSDIIARDCYALADAMVRARSASLPLSKGQEEGNG